MTSAKKYFDEVDLHVNFPEMEEKLQKHWYESGVVEKYLHKNDDKKETFSFVDGPITANNPMGVHHGWGRSYKDLWQKYNNMKGKRQRFQNGFDCQGLWVEVEVEKELGLKSKKDIEELVPGDKNASIAKFVDLCKERVYKYSGIQTEQTKRLGNFMDWEHSYFTMSDENNYMIWHFLKTCHDHGWIYKGKDSVAWCPRCETAISQHEMLTEDYKELVHQSIYFALPVTDSEDENLLVWTTTPWTLPANIAVAVDGKVDYSLVSYEGQKYWIAKELVEVVFKNKDHKVVKTVKGTELNGLKYSWAFDQLPKVKEVAKANPDTFHTVVLTDDMIMPISVTEGTGMVHTAVSAGMEDFKLGKKLGLPMIEIIDDTATYMEGFAEFSGQNAKKHPEVILDYLKEEDTKGSHWVFAVVPYKHRYPACWRCKTELVWKVADEWYIAMDEPSKSQDPNHKSQTGTLRERMIKVAKEINWIPGFGLERELDWLNNMHDWLISKPNRYWGLALPIYECKKCGYFEVLGGKEELKEKAVEGWDKFDGHTPHKPWIDEVKIKCSQCGEVVERLGDVGNVWLDAGIVPFSTIAENNQGEPLYLKDRKKWEEWFPADFITESFPGQFKNWFYSLIAMSTVLENKAPMKTILGYATMVGEDGRPMHKSWGNSIEFNEGAEKIGADVMRWIFAKQSYTDNLPFGYKVADETRRQFHLKLWNVYNFFVTYANLNNWSPATVDWIKVENILDVWICARLSETIESVTKNLDEYNAQGAATALENFVDDLSNWYIRRSRDRVGLVNVGKDQDDFFKVLHRVLLNLSKLMAPINPHISEHIFMNLTRGFSVHLSDWPTTETIELLRSTNVKNIIPVMQNVRQIVELVHAERKAKNIPVRQPLGKVTVTMTGKDLQFKQYVDLISDELNIKKVEFKEGKELSVELDTEITPELKAEGEMRGLVRQIQEERKKIGTDLSEFVIATLPEWPKEFEEEIKRKALVKELKKGEFKVEKVS
jgi:isoleucyl-tRNA synthetase